MPKPIEAIKLTKRSVESLKPGPAPVVRYDDRLSGFGVRVMPSGHRFYFVRYPTPCAASPPAAALLPGCFTPTGTK